MQIKSFSYECLRTRLRFDRSRRLGQLQNGLLVLHYYATKLAPLFNQSEVKPIKLARSRLPAALRWLHVLTMGFDWMVHCITCIFCDWRE